MRMRLDDRAINQQIASLRLFECSPQDFPTTGDSPATIPTIHAIPLAEPPRQVSPRRPSAQHPEHPFDKATVIPPLGASRGQPSNSTLQLTPTLLADHHSPCHTAGLWTDTERMSSQCPHALGCVEWEVRRWIPASRRSGRRLAKLTTASRSTASLRWQTCSRLTASSARGWRGSAANSSWAVEREAYRAHHLTARAHRAPLETGSPAQPFRTDARRRLVERVVRSRS